MNPEIIDIPIREIKPFVSRARPRAPFERMKESIREHGVKLPIQVREIKDSKFKYERIVGEGRILACKELRRETVPAIVLDVSEGEIVGRFLAENVLRKKLPWQDKARLMASELPEDRGGINKAELNRLAGRYFVTPEHVKKMLGILQRVAPAASGMIEQLTVGEAEQLTSLPAPGQEIVIETMKAEKLTSEQIPGLVKQALELRRAGKKLSIRALRASLRRVDEDLARLRQSLKLKRLHASLGPENVRMLLSDQTFRKALDRRGINYRKFEDAI